MNLGYLLGLVLSVIILSLLTALANQVGQDGLAVFIVFGALCYITGAVTAYLGYRAKNR